MRRASRRCVWPCKRASNISAAKKANSNICTSQVLLANIAGMYAVYHGPAGVKRIAQRIHRLAALFAAGVQQAGLKLVFEQFFDTVEVDLGTQAAGVYQSALAAGINLRNAGNGVLGVAFHEQATEPIWPPCWACLPARPLT